MDLAVDALAAALEELKLRCVLLSAEAGPGAWRQPFPVDAVSVHLVLRGVCLIEVSLHLPRTLLSGGDLLIVNRGIRGALRAASESDRPEVVSARVHLEAPLGHPMLASFPPFIQGAPRSDLPSFSSAVNLLTEELEVPLLGGRAVVARVCEILVIEALRVHIAERSWTDRGWFRMVADPLVRERLVEAIRPGATVRSVARALGRSRQRTGRRVRGLTGASPSALLREARVRRAAELLRAGESDLAGIATRVGYGSPQALARAFRHQLGVSLTEHWRETHRRPFPRHRK